MVIIAHRGLVNGPDINLENNPHQIEIALKQGFHCEIDVWFVEGLWWLGHDEPTYNINYDFLQRPNLWIHAKNLSALEKLIDNQSLNVFWHGTDAFTLTSCGYIWAYPGQLLTKKSIMVLPEWSDISLSNTQYVTCFGICTDYANQLRSLRHN